MGILVPEVSDERRTFSGDDIPAYSVHLDAIRGSAACVVFLTHLRYLFVASSRDAKPVEITESAPVRAMAGVSPAPEKKTGEVHRDFGHQAVIVFFVLSGFLVGGSVVKAVRQQRWRWNKYLVHRMVRLWMVLVPALILGISLDLYGSLHFAGQGSIYAGPPGQGMIQQGIQARLQAPTFFGNLFFLQDILVTPLGTNVPLWSLANEFWYYLAFPMLALIVAARGAVFKRIAWAGVLAGLLYFVGPKIAMYFSIWLAGVVAAMLPLRIPPRFQRSATVGALVLFLVVNAAIRYHEPHVFPVDVVVALLFFLLLYCVLHLRTPSGPGIYRGGARFLSRISYSLYLTHVPVLCLASAFLLRPWRRLPVNLSTAAEIGAVTALVFAVACAVHFLFEARTDRVRRWLEARL